MQVFEYTIQPGDTLGLIAQKFTGDRNRWVEILDANPRIPKTKDRYGQKMFDPSFFQVGQTQTIYLPYSWWVSADQATQNSLLQLLVAQQYNQSPWQYGNRYGWRDQGNWQYGNQYGNQYGQYGNRYGNQYGNQYGWGPRGNGGLRSAAQINATTRSTGYQSSGMRSGGLVYGPASGQVGDDCTPDAVEPHPTAYYRVSGDERESAIAVKFGRTRNNGAWGDDPTLVGASYWSGDNGQPFWFKGFVPGGGKCVFNGLKSGDLIRIPKTWLEGLSDQQVKSLAAYPNIVHLDGSKWVPGTPTGKTPGTPGTQGPCPEGFVLDADGLTCIKGSGTKVSATDTGTGVSSWVWVALAAGAGIGGALLLNNLVKSKKTHVSAPPAAPPARKEEVVVRR